MTSPSQSRWFKAIYAHRVVLKRVLVLGFAVLVLSLLTFAVLKVDWHEVILALKELPASSMYWAAGFSLLTYFVYSSFDLLGRFYTDHNLKWWRSMLVGFISYAFTMSLGSAVGGVGMRLRLYSKQGLRHSDILRIWAISVTTNWTGYLTMIGAVLTAGQVTMPGGWSLSERVLQGIGIICLGVVLAYLLASAFSKKRSWLIRGHAIDLPDFRLVLIQIVLGAMVWSLIAAVPYTLFQSRIPYLEVLGIVLIAAVAGLAARIPGGLGVIEYVFLTMLGSTIPRGETLAVLLVYRVFYYIAPLLIAGLCYLIAEASIKSVSRRTG